VLRAIAILCGILLWSSCEETTQIPRPRTYPRVNYPEKGYQTYNPANCPFSFDIPVYASAEKDSVFFDERPPNECWTNIHFPDFKGQLYCSYYPVSHPNQLQQLIDDGHKITSKHIIRADFIDEKVISKEGRVYGVLFEVEGAAASGIQFFLTDSSRHFFNGALYFNAEVRPDSIQPIFEFVRADVMKMIETFEWK
jgi:gliding motility-associated lipoprotein GldD